MVPQLCSAQSPPIFNVYGSVGVLGWRGGLVSNVADGTALMQHWEMVALVCPCSPSPHAAVQSKVPSPGAPPSHPTILTSQELS